MVSVLVEYLWKWWQGWCWHASLGRSCTLPCSGWSRCTSLSDGEPETTSHKQLIKNSISFDASMVSLHMQLSSYQLKAYTWGIPFWCKKPTMRSRPWWADESYRQYLTRREERSFRTMKQRCSQARRSSCSKPRTQYTLSFVPDLQTATNTAREIEIGLAREGDVEHATWAPPPHWPGGGRGDFSGPTATLSALACFSVAGECGRARWWAWAATARWNSLAWPFSFGVLLAGHTGLLPLHDVECVFFFPLFYLMKAGS